MKFLSYFVPRTIYKSSSRYNKTIEVREINGRNVLFVNGIQQTGAYTHELWQTGLVPYLSQLSVTPKSILILGVGGGGLFHILRNIYPGSMLTGVDIDGEIIRICRAYFEVKEDPKTKFVKADAREFVEDKRNIGKFDLVIVDLYIGNDVPEFVTQKQFLLKLMSFLEAGRLMVINYYSESDAEKKAAKIASYFRKAKVKPVLRNIFVYVVR